MKSKLFTQILAFALAIQAPLSCLAHDVSRYWAVMGEQLGARDVRLEPARSIDDILSPKLSPEYRDYLTLLLFAEADRSK